MAVPIGNSKDVSLRVLEKLEEVEIILCEDTRKTAKLLSIWGVKNKAKLVSFYDQVEDQKLGQVVNWLKEGKQLALLTDAGSPLISDPGLKLVRKCQKENLEHTSVPGASAVINALILSGLSPTPFCFLGFLTKKKSKRLKLLETYKDIKMTKVIYESPFRLLKLLEDVKKVWGDGKQVVVCREMTKKFEQVIKGKLVDVLSQLESKKIKGEIVVLIA